MQPADQITLVVSRPQHNASYGTPQHLRFARICRYLWVRFVHLSWQEEA